VVWASESDELSDETRNYIQAFLVQKFLTIFSGADSTHLTEHARKVLLGFETTCHGNIQYAHVSRTQDCLRVLHPMSQDKLMCGVLRSSATFNLVSPFPDLSFSSDK
jgi:hypothetical protein